jgi:hypothetical protein
MRLGGSKEADARKAFFEQNPDAAPPRIGQVATLTYADDSCDTEAPAVRA